MSDDGPNFNGIGPFKEGLTISARGERMVWLTKACEQLGDVRNSDIKRLVAQCQNDDGRAKALAAINALPALTLRRLLSVYGNKAKGR